MFRLLTRLALTTILTTNFYSAAIGSDQAGWSGLAGARGRWYIIASV